jgi:hypothetical protein
MNRPHMMRLTVSLPPTPFPLKTRHAYSKPLCHLGIFTPPAQASKRDGARVAHPLNRLPYIHPTG